MTDYDLLKLEEIAEECSSLSRRLSNIPEIEELNKKQSKLFEQCTEIENEWFSKFAWTRYLFPSYWLDKTDKEIWTTERDLCRQRKTEISGERQRAYNEFCKSVYKKNNLLKEIQKKRIEYLTHIKVFFGPEEKFQEKYEVEVTPIKFGNEDQIFFHPENWFIFRDQQYHPKGFSRISPEQLIEEQMCALVNISFTQVHYMRVDPPAEGQKYCYQHGRSIIYAGTPVKLKKAESSKIIQVNSA